MLTMLGQKIEHMGNNIPPMVQDYVQNIQENIAKVPEARNIERSIGAVTDDFHNGVVKDCKKTLFNDLKPEIPLIDLLTDEEFSKLPKYMIGRQPLDSLNGLVTNLNQILKSKYSLMAAGKQGAKKKGETDLYLDYKKQQLGLGEGEGKYRHNFSVLHQSCSI